MLKAILAATAGLSLALVTAALADTALNELTPQPEQMAQPISASPDDSKQVICHHLVHEGLLMREPVCLTKRSWERMRTQTQMAVSNMEVRGAAH